MRVEAVDATSGVSPGLAQGATLQSWRNYPALMEAVSLGLITAKEAERTVAALENEPAPAVDLSDIVAKLDLYQNKFWVMRLLSRSDWIRLINLLPKALLVNALRLFDKDKLLKLILNLPPEMLLKIMLQMFSIEELVLKMPTRELMRILRSPKLTNRELIKGLRRMNPIFVQLLLCRIYGDLKFDKMPESELWQWIMRTNKMRLMEAFKTMPFKALVPMVIALVKRDPELLLLCSEDFIFRLFDKMTKASLVEACSVLPEDQLIKMLMNLPDAAMLEAAAQIDEKTLGEYLLARHANLLKSLAA